MKVVKYEWRLVGTNKTFSRSRMTSSVGFASHGKLPRTHGKNLFSGLVMKYTI